MLDVAQQVNVGLFCCSKKSLGHQNGSRVMLLGFKDQRTVGLLSVKHPVILTGGYARICVHGRARRRILVRGIGARGLTCALTDTWSIVRKCNVFGVRKGCGWRVNPGANAAAPVPARSPMLMHQTLSGRLISNSIPYVAGHR